MTHPESNQPVFAAISDPNAILEYAVQAHDLADAIIAFNRGAITVRTAAEGITWYRFDDPPAGWEQWGDMGPDDHETMPTDEDEIPLVAGGFMHDKSKHWPKEKNDDQ